MLRPRRAVLAAGALVAGLSGCALSTAPAPVPTTVAPSATSLASHDQDLSGIFKGYDGTLVVYNVQTQEYLRVHAARADRRFEPASTFKILNSLIALENGVIRDEDETITWDGRVYDTPEWNRDQTLRSAIRDSVVWAYQELASRIGRARMREYVDRVGYGNSDISGPLDYFWLDGGLRISANEQVEFLKRLYAGDLPFSDRTMAIVRKILVREQTPAYTLSGKTGSGRIETGWVGWFAGHVQTPAGAYIVAVNITSPSDDASGAVAQAIAMKGLRRLQIIP